MVKRIKAGQRKARKEKGIEGLNPAFLKKLFGSKVVGFAERPVIEKITGKPYEEVKAQVLGFFADMLMSGILKQ